jgi:hypothetical protein
MHFQGDTFQNQLASPWARLMFSSAQTNLRQFSPLNLSDSIFSHIYDTKEYGHNLSERLFPLLTQADLALFGRHYDMTVLVADSRHGCETALRLF